MGDYTVKLPDVGEGIAEAEIVEWHVAVGDVVREDDVMAEIMTDKATVELPSPVSGVVTWLGAEAGDVLAVGADLVRITTGVSLAEPVESSIAGQEVHEERDAEDPQAISPIVSSRPDSSVISLPTHERPLTPTVDHKPLAAPAIRDRAQRLDIDLAGVAGTGPAGRITHGDIDALLIGRSTGIAHDTRTRTLPVSTLPSSTLPSSTGPSTTMASPADEVERIKIIGLRRNIAERMQLAKRRIPHFTYVEEVDVTELERLRVELNSQHLDRVKLTVLPFIIRAVVEAIGTYPQMNARFDDEAGIVERHSEVRLGIAVQTPKGLMVPVVKNAGSLDLWESAAEVARLSELARTAKIKIDELVGSTITITSLGALGGVMSTPVINHPEVAIIGPNKIVERPVYIERELAARKMMNLSSSFDHRVIDGADAAAFIQTIKRLLETPALLFLGE